MKLSIVATLYRTAPHLAEFHQRCTAAARALAGEDYEIVLVNDGSPDDSLQRALQLTRQDRHLVIADLSRNFGHHRAMMTGLTLAQGELVFLIDSDLEEEPEYLLAFHQQMQQQACDVVYGVQQSRKGGWFERVSGEGFWQAFNWLSGLELPRNLITARLMTRRYVDALTRHQEREVFMAGLFHITGFDQRPHIVKKHSTSASTYTLRRKLSLLVNSVTSFSNAPLVSIFYIGLTISCLAALHIAWLLLRWFILDTPLTGWTSVMASIWLLGGMIIAFIGVVGIYLSKVYAETKQRPYAIIRQIHRHGDPA